MFWFTKPQKQPPVPHASQKQGLWLPEDHRIINEWLEDVCKEEEKQGPSLSLDPSVVELAKQVNDDPELKKLSDAMFDQIPDFPPFNKDLRGLKQVRDFEQMLRLLNYILNKGPDFLSPRDHTPEQVSCMGCPLNAILTWPMCTRAGYFFWLVPEVNEKMSKVLDAWGRFLASPASQGCLESEKGWTSPVALNLLAKHGNNGRTDHTFEQLYICDPSAKCLGFDSWDSFFTRSFREGIRPVAAADGQISDEYPDPTQVIVHSCEAAPLVTARNVQHQDSFWLKNQPFSLATMLNHSSLAHRFIGGTIYQAFLSAMSYHKWHAPVSGTVVKIQHIKGTYFSENLHYGFDSSDGAGGGGPDHAAPVGSQPYLSAVATRAVMYIEADNADIGLMAVVYIGMVEVSSCDFTVRQGQRLVKGQEVGMFHFGGSSYCMLFGPQTQLKLADPGPWEPNTVRNKDVNSLFATVIPKKK